MVEVGYRKQFMVLCSLQTKVLKRVSGPGRVVAALEPKQAVANINPLPGGRDETLPEHFAASRGCG
jgi:hypothetical protein